MKKGVKKLQNKLVVVSVVIVIALLTTGSLFIYVPFSEKIKSLKAEILKERDKNLLIGKIRAVGRHLKVYEKRVPEDASVSWLLGTVSDFASKERIEISSIKPGSPEDYGLYTKLYVIMDIASTYSQLGRFISSIESSGKFLRVEKIDIKRMDTAEKFEKSSGKYKAFDVGTNMVISTVVLKE